MEELIKKLKELKELEKRYDNFDEGLSLINTKRLLVSLYKDKIIIEYFDGEGYYKGCEELYYENVSFDEIIEKLLELIDEEIEYFKDIIEEREKLMKLYKTIKNAKIE